MSLIVSTPPSSNLSCVYHYKCLNSAVPANGHNYSPALKRFLIDITMSEELSFEAHVLLYFVRNIAHLMELVNDPVSHEFYAACIQAFLFIQHDHKRYIKILQVIFQNKLDKLRAVIVTAEEDVIFQHCVDTMQMLQRDFRTPPLA